MRCSLVVIHRRKGGNVLRTLVRSLVTRHGPWYLQVGDMIGRFEVPKARSLEAEVEDASRVGSSSGLFLLFLWYG